jgi:hypothetical protein
MKSAKRKPLLLGAPVRLLRLLHRLGPDLPRRLLRFRESTTLTSSGLGSLCRVELTGSHLRGT